MAGVLKVPDFLCTSFKGVRYSGWFSLSLQNQRRGTDWHRIVRHCMPLNWEALKRKTVQFTFFTMAPVKPLEHFLWKEPPVVVWTERLTSRRDGKVWLTALMHFLRLPRSESTQAYICSYNLCTLLETPCQIEVEPLYQNVARCLNLWSNSHINQLSGVDSKRKLKKIHIQPHLQ